MLPPPRLVRAPAPRGRDNPVEEGRLADALREGQSSAERAALERFTPYVRRTLVRILGTTNDLDDLTQEVFGRSFDRVGELRPGVALRIWFGSFAVNVAREALRARRRRRWLLFRAPEELPELTDEIALGHARTDADVEARLALRATYQVLGALEIELRMVFVLRHMEDTDLAAIARLCGVSLATVKRRLARAEEAFTRRARLQPILGPWLEEGGRWR